MNPNLFFATALPDVAAPQKSSTLFGKMRLIAAVCITTALLACGGGGGGGDGGASTPAPTVSQCTSFVDSLGRTVPCTVMNTLAGSTLAYLDAGASSDTGAGDGAVDGVASDGVAIANATLQFTDVNGQIVITTTDAAGYYRISLRGMKAPLLATVMRNNNPWKSMLVTDIVRAPANRKFYTINLTGLTDVVVSEVAKKEGLSSTDAVTPLVMQHQKDQVAGIVAGINQSISAQITDSGLNASTFNPMTVTVDNQAAYDKLLKSVEISRQLGGLTTLTVKTYTVGGSITGLGSASGLVLSNGADTLTVAANASAFVLPASVKQGDSYAVAVKTQPAGLTCSVASGTGTVAAGNVTTVAVTCVALVLDRYTLGGSIAGLGNANGLVLSNGADTLSVAANASAFVLPTSVKQGDSYAVAVQTQPTGLTCSVAGGTGTVPAGNVTNVAVTCVAPVIPTYTVGGSITGLGSASGLVLSNGADTLTVAANASTFILPASVKQGDSYTVAIKTQPAGLTCSVANGTGTVAAGNVTTVAVSCSPNSYTLGGTVSGLNADGLVLANGGQTVTVNKGGTGFAFATPIASGGGYSVTVQTQPTGLTCSVANGTGTVAAGNVSSITVTCAIATSAKFSTVGSYAVTECIKDKTTGLIWEGKTADGGLRDGSKTYTNYDNTAEKQFLNGSTYVNPTQSQIDAATNSVGYKNAVNASALCGYTNWRLPTKDELVMLVTNKNAEVASDNWFPNNSATWYWSSSPDPKYAGYAWNVYFSDGYVSNYDGRYLNGHVRLVR